MVKRINDLGYISFEDFKEKVISRLGTKEITFSCYEGNVEYGSIPEYSARYNDLDISYFHHNEYLKDGVVVEGCLFTIAKWVNPNHLVVLKHLIDL